MKFSGVWLLHVLIFPLIIAACICSNKIKSDLNTILRHAPRFMNASFIIFFAYAIVNFMLFFYLSEGLSAEQEAGKYFLYCHGKIIRKITQAEYHRHCAYVARGFSGHWMLFYCLGMTIFAGVLEIRRRQAIGEALEPEPPDSAQTGQSKTAGKYIYGEPATVAQGLSGLFFYIGIIAIIYFNQSYLNILALLISAAAFVQFIRRRTGMTEGEGSFETILGCLSIPMNFFMAIFLASVAGKILSLPAIFICTLGLTHLMETFGRFFEDLVSRMIRRS